MHKLEKTIYLPAVVVFVAVMAVVSISFLMSRNAVSREVDTYISDYSEKTEGLIKDQLTVYEETLRAGAGVFAVDTQVTKDDFSNFIKTTGVLDRYSSAQSIAYAPVVQSSGLQMFSEQLRQSSIPTFTVRPVGERSQTVPVIYIEPQSVSNLQVVGFDIFSEAVRAKALNMARDSGTIAVTDTIQSPIDQTPAGRAFAMYAPQYKRGMPIETIEQRRAAIEGFLYSGFRISKFIDNTGIDSKNPDIGFTISLGSDRAELYTSDSYKRLATTANKSVSNDLNIGGNIFRFTYAYEPNNVLPLASSRPLAIFIFGTITALLLATAVWLVLRGKANELLLEQERGINEAKDDLLSLASHQLRTPATGVKQYIGLLLQGYSDKLTDNQRLLLEKAYAGNERQLKTINDVLYLARLGSGRIVLSKSNFSMVQIIQDITGDLRGDIASKNHTISLKIPKSDKPFYGDEHMIRMAIENLLTNAVKYTHPGGEITIQLSSHRNVKISVQDNGVGIEKSQQNRLFKQFERIDNDLSISVGGSGIGLYVVNNIVSLHGGHMEVVSEAGKGSRFTIVLPRQKTA